MGTWIEICRRSENKDGEIVVPHVGTWIEIQQCICLCLQLRSSPMWGRGLKSHFGKSEVSALVVPHVGAWIEMNK